ncbi:sugar phosphate nucleotidyltransferase [Lactiplantibacillus fabifermentans]|uniref:UTP--glucose-1-phosphate uridylyltransferase n=1 Tax=Lactiplantibacillus fabifermentans DSM 21115 TaxID=1413187 RepID=A0A0R2NPL1_9LACO|nr:sugar phosphate nucleotidyltransferase [Lactiplantibacillus fabifermentans]KRO26352.1 galU protein [Lactiplantibacillus fabifermentans DSM 21115]
MKKINKAIILAAGLGTRLLPATKTTPAALLPVGGQPLIQHLVTEIQQAGVQQILIVTADSAIEDYFDDNSTLNAALSTRSQFATLKTLTPTTPANLYFVRQAQPRGAGDALLAAQNFVGDEPCLVLTTNTLTSGHPNLTKQLLRTFNRLGAPLVAVTAATAPTVSSLNAPHTLKITALASLASQTTLDLAGQRDLGRYVLTPEIFTNLASQRATVRSESTLTDAIAALNQTQRVFTATVTGATYAVDDPLSFAETNLAFSWQQPALATQLQQYAANATAPQVAPAFQMTLNKKLMRR